MTGAGDSEPARPVAQPALQMAGNGSLTKQATSSANTQERINNASRAQETAQELAEKASAESDALGEIIAEEQDSLHLAISQGLQHSEVERRNASGMQASGQALSDDDDIDSGDEEE